ncbi:uncharacterized protein LOC130760189 isoform X2 [Actinidia eriantha]|uniref:uncharacterized protein LOC130760189 isoform X2 n=1 Tax=Actinidia eriantha TaxID=165200 RepID=UPI00258F0BF8|nr:uncharacterized protein LOC130760189 isoform X2 [Actinidia eriantha]
MNRSSRHEQKHRLRSVLSQDNSNEGTAARTRPFSFDEVMLRRKNKKLSEEAENVSLKDSDKTSDHSISGRGCRNSDDILSVIKHVSEDILKVSSIKEDNTAMSGDKLVNRKDKVSRDPETISKATLNKDVSDKTKGGKDGKLARGRMSGDSENELEKRHARKLEGRDLYADRGREKIDKESKRKRQTEDNQRSRERNAVKKHDLGKSYEDNERSRERSAVKKHDLGKSYEDNERSRERSAVKKYDSGKLYGSKYLEKKGRKESSEFHYEESRPKRKRSRSRERDKDRGRRSVSLSPRAHKSTSYTVREQGELSTHSSKDRPKRQQSDDDRNRISNNGLSSRYQRHGGSKSKLGGYSPRKRLTEAAVRTPSPPHWSPEKKGAAWDVPPAAADSNFTVSVISNIQSSNKTVSSNTYQISSVAPVLSKIAKAVSGVFPNAAVDSIQLTQATRPMRRLYVENLPASASEKDVMECLNNFLLSSGVNRVQGSQPCISCIINKEKGQALVEFLTPEDATTSLSFDGRSFSGSILKIRRPKDFVEVATGVPDKSAAAVDTISNIVRDSPQKFLFSSSVFKELLDALLQIFIGGISKDISAEMLMEIVSAFGPLKAYHFAINLDLNESCAFLEYADQSVTLKACAGLNGMRMGGQMLTVVLATPDASLAENIGNSPFYGIPEHAKPLLQKPTQVLKLKNVLDPECLSSLSEVELEELLEDMRLECARFGTVKSVKVVRHNDCHTNQETGNCLENPSSASDRQELKCRDNTMKTETSGEHVDCNSEEISRSEAQNNDKEAAEVDKAVEGDGLSDDKRTHNRIEYEMCDPASINSIVALEELTCKGISTTLERPICEDNSTVLEEPCDDNHNGISQEQPEGFMSNDQMECCDDKVDDDTIQTRDAEVEIKLVEAEKLKSLEADEQLQEALAEMNFSEKIDLGTLEKGENGECVFAFEDVFEAGSILVEYRRIEAACMAAHSLHGRLFDNRMVVVGYIDYNIYKVRFPK